MHDKKSVFRSLAMVTQLGLCVLTPTLFAVWAGYYVDARFGTKTMLVFLVLGVLGGGRGAYLMARRLIEQEAREAETERVRLREEALKRPQAVSRPKTPSRIYEAGGLPGGEESGLTGENPDAGRGGEGTGGPQIHSGAGHGEASG